MIGRLLLLAALALLAFPAFAGQGHLPENSGSMVLRKGQGSGIFSPSGNLPDVTGSSQFLSGFDFVKEEIRALRRDRQPPANFGKFVGRVPPRPAAASRRPAEDLKVRAPIAQPAPVAERPRPSARGSDPVFDFRAPSSPRPYAAAAPQRMKPYAVPAPEPDFDFDYGDVSVPIITPDSIRRGQASVEPRPVYVDEAPAPRPEPRPMQRRPVPDAVPAAGTPPDPEPVPAMPRQAPVRQAQPPQASVAQAMPPQAPGQPRNVPVSMLLREGDVVPPDAPPIEEIVQGEYMPYEDPYLVRKDVTDIPFAMKKRERAVFYFCPYNSDSTSLWRDIRQNRDIAALLDSGGIEVLQPVWTHKDIPPAVIFAWLKTFDVPLAMEFMDFQASMPEGWLDVSDAGWLTEEERRERLDHYLGLMENWLIERGIDAEPLFIDRGVQMGLARRINGINDGFRKIARDVDKHPAIFVNGKRNEGYFEAARTLPPHQR